MSFKFLLIASLVFVAFAAPIKYPTEEEAKSELKSAGMTQQSIDGLSALTQRFVSGYPMVQANKPAADKFIADYTADANNFINAMSPEDRAIYNAHLQKYGLAK